MATKEDKWVKKWSGLLIGSGLGLIGLIGLFRCPSPIGHEISEAVLIAGLLSITVDPFLKSRFVREVSKDIFHHLLGFELPVQIRERLRDIILETNLYRKDMRIVCTFTEMEGQLHIDFETSYELINPTHKILKFRQRLDFEKAENAQLKLISCNQAKKDYGEVPTLKLNDETDLFEYAGKELRIEPSESTGKRYQFSADYSIDGFPVPGFYTQMFKYPTVGVTVRVRNVPASLRISSDIGNETDHQWISERLFMPGDHFNIRWESISD